LSGGTPQALSPNGTGFTYYFGGDPATQHSAETDQDTLKRYLASPNGSANPNQARVDDDFATLGYVGAMPTKAPPPAVGSAAPREWLAWISVRGTDYYRPTFGDDLKGEQIDMLAGLTRRITPDFVVGLFAGYETFDYTSQAFDGTLTGDGWTTGAHLGWRLAGSLRFDLGGAWSGLSANDTAGTANGNFTGTRWLTSAGLTGTYNWQSLLLEPSARVFALWEHENAYTDSLGTLQDARNFSTGRASVGAKVAYPLAWTSTVALAPYAGLYADYYFSQDDAQVAGLTTVPLLQGFAARVTGGVSAKFTGGASVSAGGEFGGIGLDTHIWTWTARGSIPF
jgi:outer membrane autotransporter protein